MLFSDKYDEFTSTSFSDQDWDCDRTIRSKSTEKQHRKNDERKKGGHEERKQRREGERREGLKERGKREGEG